MSSTLTGPARSSGLLGVVVPGARHPGGGTTARLDARTLATQPRGFEGLVRYPFQGKPPRCNALASRSLRCASALSMRSSRFTDLSGSY